MMSASLANIPPRGRKRSIGTLDEISTKPSFTTDSGPRLGRAAAVGLAAQHATLSSAGRDGMRQIKDTMEVRRAKISRIMGPSIGQADDDVEMDGSESGETGGLAPRPSLSRTVSTGSTSTGLTASTSAGSLPTRSAASSRPVPIPQPSLFYAPNYQVPPTSGTSTSAGAKLQSKYTGTTQGIRTPLELRTNFIPASSLLPALSNARPAEPPSLPSIPAAPQATRSKAPFMLPAPRPAPPASKPSATPAGNQAAERATEEKRGKHTHNGVDAAAVFAGGQGKTMPFHSIDRTKPLVGNVLPPTAVAPVNTDREPLGKDIEAIRRAAAIAEQTQKNDLYVSRYTKAWPGFVFHFDASMGEAQVKVAKEKHKKLGGRVEEFFSSTVTHIITLKDPAKASATTNAQLPTATVPAKKPHPLAASVGLANITRNGGNGGTAGAGAMTAKANGLMSPFKATGGSTAKSALAPGVSSLAMKAHQAGKKVWTLAKLNTIFDQLLRDGDTSRVRPRDHDLEFLLEDEKIHGTRERDHTAPRPDWFYFSRADGYILVEDATGEHRPMMAKAYVATAENAQPWPQMYRTFMRPSEAALRAAVSPKSARDRAMSLYVDRVPFRSEMPPVSTTFSGTGGLMEKAIGGAFTRTTSLANLRSRAQADASKAMREEALQPYQGASGNTVTLTSNVASTSTAMLAVAGAQQNLLGESGPTLGQNKQLARMSKRIQVNKRVELLKSNLPPRALEQAKMEALQSNRMKASLATGPDEVESESDLEIMDEEPRQSSGTASDALAARSSSSSSDDRARAEKGTDSQQESKGRMDTYVREMVLEILKKANEPVERTPAEIAAQAKARAEGRHLEDEITAPGGVEAKAGYCENCRMKYEDFEVHIQCRRHRRFAEDDSNFEELDALLDGVQRLPLVT